MKRVIIQKHYFAIALLVVQSVCFGQTFLYRADGNFNEPRFAHARLTSVNMDVYGGIASSAYNSDGKNDSLLNMYGLNTFKDIGKGVPNLDPSNTLDAILINLWNQPANGDFAKLKFAGELVQCGMNFGIAQNLMNGFFVSIDVPVNHVKTRKISFVDQSPTSGLPNANSASWKQFIINYENIAARYGLNLDSEGQNLTSVGDVNMLLGWSCNNETIETFDFFDVTIKMGVVIPSAPVQDVNKPFVMATGNNGHVGIPLSFDAAVGMYEWITVGAHMGALFFSDHTREVRMKTAVGQNGFIKLAKGFARCNKGYQWDVGTFLKADHVIGGLSLNLGYKYTSKDTDSLTPENRLIFSDSIVNSDEMLQGWSMHALQALVEYDFAQENARYNPKISAFFSRPVGGKRVVAMNTFGGSVGMNIAWDF